MTHFELENSIYEFVTAVRLNSMELLNSIDPGLQFHLLEEIEERVRYLRKLLEKEKANEDV